VEVFKPQQSTPKWSFTAADPDSSGGIVIPIPAETAREARIKVERKYLKCPILFFNSISI
jgi:hypothetical protein